MVCVICINSATLYGISLWIQDFNGRNNFHVLFTWTVFPKPISSAKMAPLRHEYCLYKKAMPSFWYSRKYRLIVDGTFECKLEIHQPQGVIITSITYCASN